MNIKHGKMKKHCIRLEIQTRLLDRIAEVSNTLNQLRMPEIAHKKLIYPTFVFIFMNEE